MGYAERPLASSIVACTWEQVASAEHHQRVAGARVIGARLRPGLAGAVLGFPASEHRDLTADAADTLGAEAVETMLEQLEAGPDPHAVLARALELRGAGAPEPLVSAAVRALGHPRARVAPVAAELGLSVRQLQRRVTDAVGYGPKMLARVLRFRRLQALSSAPLAELALEAGYADQAHMTSEVTRLAGIPPVRFLKDGPPAAA